MRRTTGQAHDAAQALLDERERHGVDRRRHSDVPLGGHDLARIAHDRPDHVGLGHDARRHRAVRIGQLQEIHFGRTESGRRIPFERRSDPETSRGSQHGVDPNLGRHPDGDRVSRLGQRLANRDQALEAAVVVRDPLRRTRRSIRHTDRFVGHQRLEREAAVPKRREIHHRLHRGSRLAQ